MNLLLLADMAASADDRVAVQSGDERFTAAELLRLAWGGAAQVGDATAIAYVGTNGPAVPIALFAAAAAGVPYSPLNYRLGIDDLDALLTRLGRPLVIAEGAVGAALADRGHRVLDAADFVAQADLLGGSGEVPFDAEAPAVVLFTSGTTSAPKAALLRHRHLTSYILGTVEFAGAEPSDAALVCVPPYHVAGLANLLSNLYGGRRIVYLQQFDAEEWVRSAQAEAITHAMVVPTMMARIVDVLEANDADGVALPSLRALSYGGARTPAVVLERLMTALPDVDLTNAYGLTETSSTIAVLDPDDHRAARGGDPVAVARLASAGRVLPTIEVQIRDDDGTEVGPGETGELWVRGEQVSGEYDGIDSPLDAEGWFPTRDRASIDGDGYLFIEGRSDDTIIRGGENIAPAEIEEVLLRHPAVDDCAVFGVPDDEWGQRIAAAIVTVPGGDDLDAADVQAFVRASLRGSKTPQDVHFVDALPYTDTGKLLRRRVPDVVSG